MAHAHILVGANSSSTQPVIRRISPSDLYQSLARGIDDFAAMPSHAVFLCVIYPLLGIVLIGMTLGNSTLPLAFPIAAGFALVGPLAAIGLYELSRRREAGLDSSSSHAFDVLHSPSLGAIVALGMLLMAIFLIWLAVAEAIYVANFGYAAPVSIRQFALDVLTTPAGWTLIVVGTGVGFLFAVLALTIGAISFPLLLDRDVGAATALLTSIRVVKANPGTMALWGFIVAALLMIGSIPFFLGLTVVMPVLGHATWHLYRRAVEPDPNPHPDYQPRPRRPRSAADFPSALFPTRE
ncbi:MAG TPA: DUF2189 domain-containing protein [Xanthobacteraceae bacterium]|jgi:uncharacterized membrane protein|nr:DUF2189 domain-containing protein [Xanthobacteraceae bacterium]